MKSIAGYGVVLLTILVTVIRSKKHYCPNTTVCICDKLAAICKAKGERLRTIPKLPKYIEELRFAGNNLSILNKDTFKSLKKLKLRKLLLMDNCITNVSADAFSELPFLWKLDLSSNPHINIKQLSSAFQSINRTNFEMLNLNNVSWTELSSESFLLFHGSKIAIISLKKNKFSEVNFDVFKNLPKLRTIDLSFNSIRNITGSVKLSSINNVLLRSNLLHLPSSAVVFSKKCIFPKLKILHIEANSIVSFKDFFQCLVTITDLFLDQNSITVLYSNTFTHMKKLKRLSLSRLGTGLRKIEDYAFDIPSLKQLSLAGNRMHFGSALFSFNPYTIFRELVNLDTIDVSSNSLSVSNSVLIRMFSPLKKIKRLILQEVKWATLPYGFFKLFPQMEKLVISGNNFGRWNGSQTFGGVKKLQSLYMEGNIISMVDKSSFPENILRTLRNISLFDNPFDCSCDLLWFQTFLRTTNISVIKYPSRYICVGKDRTLVKDARLCVKNPAITIAISMSSTLVFIFIVAVAIYKGRWHLRYMIFVVRKKKNDYQRVPMDEDCVYDGYVVYCDEDRKWVHEHMIPALEGEAELRLCIRMRDFMPGRIDIENVVENMALSRKIILVLSKNFAESGWCEFQMLLAQTRLIEEGYCLLVSVMLEEIDSRRLSKSLHALVTMTPYYLWTEEDVGKRLFWEQVKKAVIVKRELPRNLNRQPTEYGSIQ